MPNPTFTPHDRRALRRRHFWIDGIGLLICLALLAGVIFLAFHLHRACL